MSAKVFELSVQVLLGMALNVTQQNFLVDYCCEASHIYCWSRGNCDSAESGLNCKRIAFSYAWLSFHSSVWKIGVFLA
jgi:hypothetical protein